MTIWNILRPFGFIYGLLVPIFCGYLVYIFQFGMFGPRNIWQPWWQGKLTRENDAFKMLSEVNNKDEKRDV
jgi:hypothetical protein